MDQAVRVDKPRLRSQEEEEIAIPAHEALREASGLGNRMLELPLAGLGTWSYGRAVVGQMAETVGIGKSSVSHQASKAAGERF